MCWLARLLSFLATSPDTQLGLDTRSSRSLSLSLSSVPSEHSVIPLVLGFLLNMSTPLSSEVAELLQLSSLSMVNTIPSSL